MKKLALFVAIIVVSFCAASVQSQNSEDYQKKIDSLELIKAELTLQIENIDKEVKILKPLKSEVWTNEQIGQIFVFVRDGFLYDVVRPNNKICDVKKGTRVIFVKEIAEYFLEVLYNGDRVYVLKNWIVPLLEIQQREINQKNNDSLAAVNASPYTFKQSASIYKTLGKWNTEQKVTKGTEVLFIKNIQNGRTSEIIYQDSIFYTLASNIVNREEYRKIIESENNYKERLEIAKQALIDKYGTLTGIRVFENNIWIGMTKEMLIDSWGNPSDINRTVTASNVSEQCIYGSTYVYLDNGVVTAWQD